MAFLIEFDTFTVHADLWVQGVQFGSTALNLGKLPAALLTIVFVPPVQMSTQWKKD